MFVLFRGLSPTFLSVHFGTGFGEPVSQYIKSCPLLINSIHIITSLPHIKGNNSRHVK